MLRLIIKWWHFNIYEQDQFHEHEKFCNFRAWFRHDEASYEPRRVKTRFLRKQRRRSALR